MRVEDCYQLGYVIKTHGLKGEVQIFLDVDIPGEYQGMESVFVNQDNSLVPFFLEYIQVGDKKSIVKFEEIDSIEEASKLVSSQLYLPLDMLPKLPDGKYYFHQLVGLNLIDNGKTIGEVTQVYEMGPQNLLSVDHNGVEVMVPLSPGIIGKVDFEKFEIQARLPDGLIDIYLEDNED